MDLFFDSCRRQYEQTMAMVRGAIELCPDEVWAHREEREPPFWHQMFHALKVTEGYAGESFDDLRTELAVEVLQPRRPVDGEPSYRPLIEAIGRLMDADYQPPGVVDRAAMLELADHVLACCLASLDRDADRPVDDPAANRFPWTGTTSFDKHIYNLRHLHHHLGRINGLLRRQADIGNPWVMATPPASG
ncbi:MAG: DinB family protein [Acidobacteriota bacterium]